MNSRGQAAITDALFFLVIVMSLVVFLFFFTSQYGRSVGEYSDSKYSSDYASSALKTVLYSSFARDGLPLCIEESCSKEVDFLIAAIKEDYADDKNINYFKDELTESIKLVMKPVRNSFDFMLFIKISSDSVPKYPYFFISRKEFSYQDQGPFVSDVQSEEKNYYCNVSQSSSFNQNKIDEFIVFTGVKGLAVSSLWFPLVNTIEYDKGEIDLILWNPKDFNESQKVFKELDCQLIE